MTLYTVIRTFLGKLNERKRRSYIENLQRKGLKLGRNVEIVEDFFFDPSHCFLITIGDNCTICPNVRLIAHDASTKKHLGYTKIGRITILENCFIGDSVIILPCVTIGPNSIIGSGSVVTKDIPPESVAVGNPARVICSLDEYLCKIEVHAKHKKILSEEYWIDQLDERMRNEIIDSIGDKIGFII